MAVRFRSPAPTKNTFLEKVFLVICSAEE